ncbi:snRNA-activating protein complex subunit 3 [Calliphora vicina]|uniref:snRNA-activating protein complex subunit 3 n=1 Tax=Calliphora vicina TaxID=7373 RepID=UPI00325AB307
MEEILGQNMRTPINLKQFLSNYNKIFKHPYTIPSKDINIQDALQLSNDDEQYNTVQENCSLEHIKQSSDPRVAEFLPGFSEIPRKTTANIDIKSVKLKSFELLIKHKQCKKPSAFQRSRECFTMLKPPSAEGESLQTIRPGEELLIYVRFYRPARATHIGRTLEKPVFSQEFACLGRNLLSELRDKVYCVCNNKRFFDVSEHPEDPLPTKDADPGFFFITDTFYNDKRHPGNMDYSQAIRSWAKKAKGLDNLKFKVARLEETRFIDLTISLGFPQLYQHHGNCEHVFVFSNIEVITNPCLQVLPSLSSYPYVQTISRFNTRTCNICGKMNYVFVVEGSNRQLQDPAYLCKQCFISFHYVDGKKIGEFSAYRLNDELRNPDEESIELFNDGEEIPQEIMNDEYSDEIANEIIDNNSDNSEEIDIIIKEETICNIEDN